MGFLKRIEQHHLAEAASDTQLELEVEAEPQFRASSFPYCPILDLEARLDPEKRMMVYRSHFYFGIGTAVHSLWQTMMAYSPNYGEFVYGKWRCPKCKWRNKIDSPQFRPKNSPTCSKGKCPSYWEYVELDFNWHGLSAHCDQFACYDKKDDWVAFELKTTSAWQLEPGANSKYIPYKKHLLQVKIYCTLIRLIYEIKIKRYTLVYTSRENPDFGHQRSFTYPFTERDFLKTRNLIVRAINGRNLVNKISRKGLTDDLLDKMLERRPCHSAKDYKEKMDHAFFGKEKCPHYKDGSCARTSTKKIKKHLQAVWEEQGDILVTACRERDSGS
jgi:hypothetical protein